MKDLGLRFKSRVVLAIGILIVGQQLIVASSSLWLVRFSESLTSVPRFGFLTLFLASLVLPYAPGAISHFLLKFVEFDSLDCFWTERGRVLRGRIDLRGDNEMRATQQAVLVRDAPQLIQELVAFLYELASALLNVFFNIVAVCYLTSGWFIASYSISIGIAVGVLTALARLNSSYAALAEDAKVGFNRILGNFWDNVIVDNRSNRALWQKARDGGFVGYRRSGIQASALRESSTVLLSLATFIPTLITIALLAYGYRYDLSRLVALTVLLPRIFMILNYTTTVVHQIRDIPIYRGRALQLQRALKLKEAQSIPSRVQEHLISIYDNGSGRFLPLKATLPKQGWLTVRGPNGSGKSSWLAGLKRTFGDQAFYYPAHSDLLFDCDATPLSTGQRVRSEIEKILALPEVPMLLLDEWDANLDSFRQAEIAALLSAEGQRRLVIDVRH